MITTTRASIVSIKQLSGTCPYSIYIPHATETSSNVHKRPLCTQQRQLPKRLSLPSILFVSNSGANTRAHPPITSNIIISFHPSLLSTRSFPASSQPPPFHRSSSPAFGFHASAVCRSRRPSAALSGPRQWASGRKNWPEGIVLQTQNCVFEIPLRIRDQREDSLFIFGVCTLYGK